jgi:hypothetical protein
MIDNIITYDPETNRVVYPNGVATPLLRAEHATAKALHEARQEVGQLAAEVRILRNDADKTRDWIGRTLAATDDLPPGVAPHPSLGDGEYLALGEDVRNLPDGKWQRKASMTTDWDALSVRSNREAAPQIPYIVRRIPAPATKRVPLHKVIGERLPSHADLPIFGFGISAKDGAIVWAEGTVSWHLPVADDGTVKVLA